MLVSGSVPAKKYMNIYVGSFEFWRKRDSFTGKIDQHRIIIL